MAKLHYEVTPQTVSVTLYEGEGWSDENRKVVAERSFDVGAIPAELETNGDPKSLAAYGLAKLLQERPSGEPDPAKKLAQMDEVYATLSGGKWREYREGGSGGGRGPKLDAIFVQAVADVKKVKVPQAEAGLRALDKDTIKKIKNLPEIKERMAKLREGAGDGVDLNFTFDE